MFSKCLIIILLRKSKQIVLVLLDYICKSNFETNIYFYRNFFFPNLYWTLPPPHVSHSQLNTVWSSLYQSIFKLLIQQKCLSEFSACPVKKREMAAACDFVNIIVLFFIFFIIPNVTAAF